MQSTFWGIHVWQAAARCRHRTFKTIFSKYTLNLLSKAIFVLNMCNAYVWSGKTDSIPTHHTLAGTIRVSFTEVRLRAQVPVDDPGRRFAEVLDTKPIAHTDLCITLGARVPREPSRSSSQPSSLQPKTRDTSAE
jgi:hypothetical protein